MGKRKNVFVFDDPSVQRQWDNAAALERVNKWRARKAATAEVKNRVFKHTQEWREANARRIAEWRAETKARREREKQKLSPDDIESFIERTLQELTD